jgi:hypothetical protein
VGIITLLIKKWRWKLMSNITCNTYYLQRWC